MAEPILVIEHVSKQFPGVLALDDVSFEIQKGHIHALVGENGAGKSTLIKLLSGVNMLEHGNFYLGGKQMKFTKPLEAIQNGMSVVHQEIKLVDTLSVAENIFIGRPPMTKLNTVNRRKLNSDARVLLDSIGSDIDERDYVKVNYRIHTDAIKEHLIPHSLTPQQINHTYSNKADILNMALFSQKAKEITG